MCKGGGLTDDDGEGGGGKYNDGGGGGLKYDDGKGGGFKSKSGQGGGFKSMTMEAAAVVVKDDNGQDGGLGYENWRRPQV